MIPGVSTMVRQLMLLWLYDRVDEVLMVVAAVFWCMTDCSPADEGVHGHLGVDGGKLCKIVEMIGDARVPLTLTLLLLWCACYVSYYSPSTVRTPTSSTAR